MINQQILDYIKQQFQQSVSREQIKSSLMANGWSEKDINEAFGILSTNSVPPPQSPVPQPQYASAAPATQAVKYAGFWVRTAAYFVDVFVLSVPIAAISFLVFGNTLLDTVYDYSDFVPMVGLFVVILFTVTKYQATPGKMIVGLQIQRTNGERIGFGRVFLREIIGKFLSMFTLFIGYVMIAWTDKKQGLYDKIADTVVIEKDPNKSKTGWAVFAALMLSVLIIGFGIFGAIIGVAIKSELSNASVLTGAESQQMITAQPRITKSGEKVTVFGISKYPKDAASWTLRVDVPEGVSAGIGAVTPDGKTAVGETVEHNKDIVLGEGPYSAYPQLILFVMGATNSTTTDQVVTIVSKTFDSSGVLLNQSSVPITVKWDADTVIFSLLQGARGLSDQYEYVHQQGGFTGLCTSHDPASMGGIFSILNELKSLSGSVVCKDSQTTWAISARRKSDSSKYFCIDAFTARPDSQEVVVTRGSAVTTTSCK